jgi:hypothetical protein
MTMATGRSFMTACASIDVDGGTQSYPWCILRQVLKQATWLVERIAPWLGGAGILATVAAWSIGNYNNALAVSLSAHRRTIPNGTEDRVVLELRLKKQGPTRVRLDGCAVEIKALDGPPVANDVSIEVGRNFTDDFRGTDAGVSLVRDDDLGFQASFRVPHDQTIHVRILVKAVQEMFEWLDIAKPAWPSSIVIPPSD